MSWAMPPILSSSTRPSAATPPAPAIDRTNTNIAARRVRIAKATMPPSAEQSAEQPTLSCRRLGSGNTGSARVRCRRTQIVGRDGGGETARGAQDRLRECFVEHAARQHHRAHKEREQRRRRPVLSWSRAVPELVGDARNGQAQFALEAGADLRILTEEIAAQRRDRAA